MESRLCGPTAPSGQVELRQVHELTRTFVPSGIAQRKRACIPRHHRLTKNRKGWGLCTELLQSSRCNGQGFAYSSTRLRILLALKIRTAVFRFPVPRRLSTSSPGA